MLNKLGLSVIIGILTCSYSVFAQGAQERIVQSIIINGQQVEGVMVVQNGVILGQSCADPQPYVAADQSSNGWACFESSSGVWLLHAQPPQQAATPQRPTVVYAQPAPVYVTPPDYTYPYYPYYAFDPFGYPYYPYSYPYFVGPTFGFRFGSGFGFRSPVIVHRPFVGRPFTRPVVGRPVPGVPSRPVAAGFSRGGRSFGGAGRR